MCGIAGIARLGTRPVQVGAIKRMCDAIAHRGPDDAGYAFFKPGTGDRGRGGVWHSFVDPAFRHLNEHLPVFTGEYAVHELEKNDFAVALGHRRLSILDLTHKGHQPMATSDQRFWIAYNGEVYNFRELRAELEERGYVFHTRSDTEVLLYLWEEYGRKSLQKLNGMFALAVYDRLENMLVLARDRFGVKPLYWSDAGGTLVFASEIKALLESGYVPADIDPASLVEYFTFQNLYGDKTLWRSVRLLEPGQCLTVRPGLKADIRLEQWFDGFPAADPALAGDPRLANTVAETFHGSVSRQLVSDVPVGSYLSGGMDSGSIVAVAGRSIPRMHTFTGGFDLTNVNGIEQGFDERREAERLSYLLQTEHYDVVLHAGDMPAAMDKITWHMDDPRVGMCHQVWYVAKLASRFVKVCLAGTGGDELFAGYPWRYRLALQGLSQDEFTRKCFESWHRLLPRGELPALFSTDVRRWIDAPQHSLEAVMATAPQPDPDLPEVDNALQRALHFEFKTFLNGLLVTEDKISMAHSMESRVPFLDNELADLAWRIPASRKLRTETLAGVKGDTHIDSADGKLCLRQAMEDYLPKEFLYQQKQGFSPPDENWYRGPSMTYIKEILLDRQTLTRPWFDTGFMQAKLDEHFKGQRNHRLLVWSLLSFEWIQRHFAAAGSAVSAGGDTAAAERGE